MLSVSIIEIFFKKTRDTTKDLISILTLGSINLLHRNKNLCGEIKQKRKLVDLIKTVTVLNEFNDFMD